ncbi:zinc finger protein [Macleaya cordata]|uniref:Zinc finger protein n=1 Tax=Macleaya cordata TaxID=56857 RepID=A0A200Q0F1_MACCD|nr:zinc finger protein [Macleaya cordata]
MDEQKQKQLNDSPLSSINDSTEDQTLESCDEVEEINDSFLCCICLDLLYKPVVLACGHISCFWCVHRAMSAFQESHCPICRCEYNHFPSICELLHFLLLKMYPVAYKRREKQLLEEEKRDGCFSPQFDDNSLCISNKLSSPCPPTSSIRCSQTLSYPKTHSSRKTNPSPIMDSQNSDELFRCDAATLPEKTCAGNSEVTENVSIEEDDYLNNDLNFKACKVVSIIDALCITCKQLLFRPVVLNCGHAYCESCLAISENETLICQLCRSPHPNGFPKVCLELDHFLEARFSKEYMLRREAVQPKPIYCQKGIPSACLTQAGKRGTLSSSSPSQDYSSCLSGCGPNVHFGAGCDYCGMYPIIGERYRCKDCVEAVGFDLCGVCYNTRSKRPGRFNQQHTLDHSFELVPSISIRNLLLRLIPDQSEDDSSDPDLHDDAPEDAEVTHSTI